MSRRGLTFVEILAATVLLSLLVAACLPVLTESMAALGRETLLPDTVGLARVADRFLSDPAAFDVKDFSPRETESLEIVIPEDLREPNLEVVHVKVLGLESHDVEHCWLIFGSEALAVARWMKLPPLEEVKKQ
jgi:hypothetical protein